MLKLRNKANKFLTRSAKVFLKHKFDYISINETPILNSGQPVLDDWGRPTYEDNLRVYDRKCLFLWLDAETNESIGSVTQKIPTLYVLSEEDIDVGDMIYNIRDGDNIVLGASMKVESVNPLVELGVSVMKVLQLSSAQTEG